MKKTVRAFALDKRGVIATETAFLVPLVLVGIMMFMELARVMVTITVGSTAMDAVVQSLRQEKSLTPDTVKQLIIDRMANKKFSYGYLSPKDIEVEVDHYPSLDSLGIANGAVQDGEELVPASKSRAVWSITVDIRKNYITPLPRLLTLEDMFRYRFKQVLGYLDIEFAGDKK